MNLKDQLVDSSKIIGEIVAKNVGEDNALYKQILDLVLYEPMPMSSRAGRVLNICTENKPSLFVSYIDIVINHIKKNKDVHRCILKIFAEIPYSLNEKQEGIMVDFCFNILGDESQSIANKIYAMEILEKFAMKEPGLIPELVGLLEENLQYGSTGVKNRAGRTLRRLKRKK